MATITNISTYRFTPMRGLKELREELIRDCKSWNLKGTILLSEEGINLFVAGAAEDIDRVMAKLRALPGLKSLEPKMSLSDHQPFNRMLVRIKKEIIWFGVEGVDPARHTSSPKLAPRELLRGICFCGRLLKERLDWTLGRGSGVNSSSPGNTALAGSRWNRSG